ncbi:MAG: hypothetical protein IJ147_07950 [Lachnospiraceae bacterium]|nr:hypothetical protein [Lachnospiraceae bacterium]
MNGTDGKERTDREKMVSDKREGAMRLFEAFSGVDEKYLEACEQPKVVPFARLAGFHRRYGKLVAAALVFCVAGAGYLGREWLRMGSGPANTVDMAPAQYEYAAEQAAEDNLTNGVADTPKAETAPVGAAAGITEPSDKEAEEKAAGIREPSDKEAEERAAGITEMFDRKTVTGTEPRDSGVQSNKTQGEAVNGRIRTEAAAEKEGVADLYAYVPKVWPQGCETEVNEITREENAEDPYGSVVDGKTESSDESYSYEVAPGYLEVKGSYPGQTDAFVLHIMEFGGNEPGTDRIGKAYTEEEFDLACAEKEMAGGKGDFSVLYRADDRYVLIRFNGSGIAREIWEMFASVRPQ